jgi:hypothetical protein
MSIVVEAQVLVESFLVLLFEHQGVLRVEPGVLHCTEHPPPSCTIGAACVGSKVIDFHTIANRMDREVFGVLVIMSCGCGHVGGFCMM